MPTNETAPALIDANNVNAETFFNLCRLAELTAYADPAAAVRAQGLRIEVDRDDCGNITAARIVADKFGALTTRAAPVISAFNTGRLYTKNGQRVAWCVLPSGNVAMYDLDRMIDYVLAFPPGFDPTERDVLRAYDGHGGGVDNTAPYATNRADYAIAADLQPALMQAARDAKNVR